MAAAESGGRINSKICMKISLVAVLSAFSNLLDRFDDIGVGTATADIAAHQFLHGRVVWTTRLVKQRHCRHDLARRAVAALIGIASKKSRLHRVQCVRRDEALDGCDLMSVVHEGEVETGEHALAIDVDRAGAALPMVATFFVPVSVTVSRMQSSNVVRGSIFNLWSLPLIRSVIGTAPSIGGRVISVSTAPLACTGKYVEITLAAAVVPLVFRNSRRD